MGAKFDRNSPFPEAAKVQPAVDTGLDALSIGRRPEIGEVFRRQSFPINIDGRGPVRLHLASTGLETVQDENQRPGEGLLEGRSTTGAGIRRTMVPVGLEPMITNAAPEAVRITVLSLQGGRAVGGEKRYGADDNQAQAALMKS